MSEWLRHYAASRLLAPPGHGFCEWVRARRTRGRFALLQQTGRRRVAYQRWQRDRESSPGRRPRGRSPPVLSEPSAGVTVSNTEAVKQITSQEAVANLTDFVVCGWENVKDVPQTSNRGDEGPV
jgi:hypothetical protein